MVEKASSLESTGALYEAPVDGPRYSKPLAMLVAAALVCAFLFSVIFEPSQASPNGQYFTVCGFKNLTSLPCPGCGLTHSICSVGKGDLATAFAFNLLGPPLYLAAILGFLRSLMVLTERRRLVLALDNFTARYRVVASFLLAFMLYGLGRIIYLLAAGQSSIQESPLFRFLSG